MKLFSFLMVSLFSLSALAADIQSMHCGSKKGKFSVIVDLSSNPKSLVNLVDESRDWRNPVKTKVPSKISRNGSGYEVQFNVKGTVSTFSFDLIPNGMSGGMSAELETKGKTEKVICNASRNPQQNIAL